MKTFSEIQSVIGVTPRARSIAMNSICLYGDIYVFGVWSGMSLNFEVKYLENKKIEYRKIFGFDSYEGFPEEEDQKYNIVGMEKGEFSSSKLYNTTPIQAAKIIKEGINSDQLVLVPGYFSDSLTKQLIKKQKMLPASFIDVDADLYSSTQQCLEFMFSNDLIVADTVIYFDDSGTTDKYKGGESLAWQEIVRKYEVKYTQIFTIGSQQSVQKVFRIL